MNWQVTWKKPLQKTMSTWAVKKPEPSTKKKCSKCCAPLSLNPFTFTGQTTLLICSAITSNSLFATFGETKNTHWVSIAGLAAGIIASVLIFQYTNFENSYDSLHDESDGKVYRMSRKTVGIETGEQISLNAATFHGFHPAVAAELPEVISSTHVFQANGVLTLDNTGHNVPKTYFSTGSFFDVFSFPLISGTSEDLDRPGSVFLSQTVSRRIFGDTNPVGKLIHYNDNASNVDLEVQVKGVFIDFPDNSHIKADILLPMADLNTFADNGWFGSMKLNEVTWRWGRAFTLTLKP